MRSRNNNFIQESCVCVVRGGVGKVHRLWMVEIVGVVEQVKELHSALEHSCLLQDSEIGRQGGELAN